MNYGSLLNDSDPHALKGQVSLAAVVQAHGVELRPLGERLVGQCPFHEDSDPSFAVWKIEDDVELCGCWVCDFRPGDVYDFLRRKLGSVDPHMPEALISSTTSPGSGVGSAKF